jgi:pimeloyl-ACP methyl ester carboxylesterase
VTGLSDSLVAWMRDIRLERTALVGNSLGYQIIVNLAVRHPERFEWAVLQGPAMDPGREPFWDRCGDSCSTRPENPSPSSRSNSSTTSRQERSVGYLRFLHYWVSKVSTGAAAHRTFAYPCPPLGGSGPA